MTQRLVSHSRDRADSVFCWFVYRGSTEPITFAQLFERSCDYAREYRARGVAPGDLVLIILQHSPHLFYSYLGAMLAGAIPSFMPFPTPKQRPELYWQDHAILFDRIAPRLIVTYRKNRDAALASIEKFPFDVLLTEDVGRSDVPAADELPGLLAEPDAVACLQHSSGTTSLKKGVMLTHRAIVSEVLAYNRAIGFERDDVIASWLPLYHDMGFIACFMRSVVVGSALVAIDPFDWVIRPHLLLEAIENHRAAFCWLPNFAFSHMANVVPRSKAYDLSSMRAFINCSEPCKPRSFDRFAERFASDGVRPEMLQVCYAMAENVFGVTQTRVGGRPERLVLDTDAYASGIVLECADGAGALSLLSCGEPIEGVEIRIRGENGAVVGEDHIGEIEICSPFLFEGYYKLPDVTAERFHGRWFATRDMGFVRDGSVYVTGRKDDMLIVNGRNYYAHEIEAIVGSIPDVLPGRIVAISVEQEASDAAAVVVLAECPAGSDVDTLGREVRSHVLEKLGLSIHALVTVEPGRLVKTTSGKISRNKNKELFLQGKF